MRTFRHRRSSIFCCSISESRLTPECADARGENRLGDTKKVLTDIRHQAFEEQDRAIIEAQHRSLMTLFVDTSRPVVLEIDAGPVQFRRLLDRLIKEEAVGTDRHAKCTK
jgi:hypothetical protein